MKFCVMSFDENKVFAKYDGGLLSGKNTKPFTGYDKILAFNNEILASKTSDKIFISNKLKLENISVRMLNQLISNVKLPFYAIFEDGEIFRIENRIEIIKIISKIFPESKSSKLYSLDLKIIGKLLNISSENHLDYSAKMFAFTVIPLYSDLKVVNFMEDFEDDVVKVSLIDFIEMKENLRDEDLFELINYEEYADPGNYIKCVFVEKKGIIIVVCNDYFDDETVKLKVSKFIDDLTFITGHKEVTIEGENS